jgi:hypothetical protein
LKHLNLKKNVVSKELPSTTIHLIRKPVQFDKKTYSFGKETFSFNKGTH